MFVPKEKWDKNAALPNEENLTRKIFNLEYSKLFFFYIKFHICFFFCINKN
jgi:hypothetical protein